MRREITIVTCDFCGAELAEDGARPRFEASQYGGGVAYVVDACDPCRGRVTLGELAERLERGKEAPADPATSRRR